MERAVFVYTTYPSVVEAEQAGRVLVERRLCACVNILPGLVSLYWWQGAIERGDEVVLSNGMVGKVTRVEETEAMVEISQGVSVRVGRSMIAEVRNRTAIAANDKG